MSDLALSREIEKLLVARNLRSMASVRAALEPGYVLRAANLLSGCTGHILIGTGFPVDTTFETDGPVGAISLYRALEALGATCHIACATPLAAVLEPDYRVLPLTRTDHDGAEREARERLHEMQPDAIISIERPGLAADGHYYNMRGEDISARCGIFDVYLDLADCPTIGIGDGGNEIGMGNVAEAIAKLDIRASVTRCRELVIADVSNWAAYGIIALLSRGCGRDLLSLHDPETTLRYLSERGSVDGVTRENTLTEDGLPFTEGLAVIAAIREAAALDALPAQGNG